MASLTEFCKKVLKPNDYAAPPAEFFVIDEWILAFSGIGLLSCHITMHLFIACKQFRGDMTRASLAKLFKTPLLQKVLELIQMDCFGTLH